MKHNNTDYLSASFCLSVSVSLSLCIFAQTGEDGNVVFTNRFENDCCTRETSIVVAVAAIALSSSLRLTLLSGSLSASLSLLKTYCYSRGLRTRSATEPLP